MISRKKKKKKKKKKYTLLYESNDHFGTQHRLAGAHVIQFITTTNLKGSVSKGSSVERGKKSISWNAIK